MLSLEQQNLWREKYRESNPSWRPATELYADLVRQQLTPTAKVLDLGCGRGGLVEQLGLPNKQVVGVDPDFASLAEHRLAIDTVQSLSDALPFAPNSFDVIFSSWVMEHLERPLFTFNALFHSLKPGGVYIFITPNQQHPLAKINQLFGSLGKMQGWFVETLYKRKEDDTFPTFYKANSQRQLETLCERSDLQINSLYYVADPTYLAFSNLLYKASCFLEKSLPNHRKIHLVGLLQKPQ